MHVQMRGQAEAERSVSCVTLLSALSRVTLAGAVANWAQWVTAPASACGASPCYAGGMSAAQIQALAALLVAVGGVITAVGAVLHSRNTRATVEMHEADNTAHTTLPSD